MSLRILGCILIVSFGSQAFPQRQRESPDFNSNIKPSEKTLRSLDQISLQDGTIQGRSSYTDSYGNPVAYDSLSDVDAQKPSNNKDNPTQYVIPGYASGILLPHEIPPRSADESRTVHDDKIHFIDPLNPNSFQSFGNAPSTSLTVPGIDNGNFRTPIDIPRPNIDLNETPIPIENPINDPLQIPVNTNLPNSPPSTVLELPIDQDPNSKPFLTGLVPPQIPSNDGVEIPRPNLNAHETPIDDSQNALNQGLLPPTEAPFNSFNSFSNPSQDGPVVITDTVFAPKPANGLLPPKDPIPFDFQTGPTINNNLNSLPSLSPSTKFTGSIDGTIGGITTSTVTTTAPLHIPVQIVHDDGKVNKYTGTFGGPPGILSSSTNPANRVVSTQRSRVQPTIGSTVSNTVAPTITTSNVNKFTGTFGGSLGVLSPGNAQTNTVSVATVTNAPITQSNNALFTTSNKKVGLNFGGPEGILRPYDNLNKN